MCLPYKPDSFKSTMITFIVVSFPKTCIFTERMYQPDHQDYLNTLNVANEIGFIILGNYKYALL